MLRSLSVFLLLIAIQNNAAADRMQIGTGVIALVGGVTNIYGQVPLGDSSAATFEYATVSDLEVFGDLISADGVAVTYKSYKETYANSPFWKFGVASISVTNGSSSIEGVLPVILYGAERKLEGNIVFGAEGGLGTTAGFGIFNFYMAAQF